MEIMWTPYCQLNLRLVMVLEPGDYGPLSLQFWSRAHVSTHLWIIVRATNGN